MRKFLGLLLIILGGFLFIGSSVTTVNGLIKRYKVVDAHSAGNLVGFLLAAFLFSYFSFWLMKKGKKLLDNPKKTFGDQLDELEP